MTSFETTLCKSPREVENTFDPALGSGPRESAEPVSAFEAELELITQKIHFQLERAAFNIIESGRLLIQAKRLLKHGQFRIWLNNNFSMSAKTANRFMAVAHVVDRLQPDSVTLRQLLTLDLRTLYRLTAKTTPEQVQNLVFERLGHNQTISYAELRTLIQEEQQEQSVVNATDRDIALLSYRVGRFTDWIEAHQTAITPTRGMDQELRSELSDCAVKLKAACRLLEQILDTSELRVVTLPVRPSVGHTGRQAVSYQPYAAARAALVEAAD